MKTRLRASLLLVMFSLTLAASGAAQDRIVLKLWPNGAPGEKGDIGPEKSDFSESPKRLTRISNVTEPTLTLYQPTKEDANGAAVVICPGGGYNILAWDLEGIEVAEWFNSFGVTAVILKYRVPRRDKDAPHAAPLQDSQRAMRLVRQNAKAWGIDPNRVGMLGFSAGGNLTVMTGLHYDEQTYARVDAADDLSARPDFLMPIYAAYLGDKNDETRLSPLVKVTQQTPPMFLAVTHDDKLRGLHAGLLLAELKKHDVPAEAHIFLEGGHGYGLRPTGDPVSSWPKLCEQWMRASGFLTPGS